METLLELPEVDPVEALIAVVGIEAIASREVEKLRAADIERVLTYPKILLNRARAMARGELPRFTVGAYDHAKLLKDLVRPWDEEQLLKTVEPLPPSFDSLIPMFVVRSQQMVEQLRDAIPNLVSKSILGITDYKPSQAAVARFGEVLEVVIDPLRAIDRMAVSALLKPQVAAVRTFFPSIAAAIDVAVVEVISDEAVTKAGARDKEYFLDRATQRGMNRWFGDSATSPALAKALQLAFHRGDEEKKPPQTDGRTSAIAKEAVPPSMRAEAKEAYR